VKRKVLLIGHYCATGGVSVHINRLATLLKKNFIVKVIDESRLIDNDGVTFNLRRKNIFKYINYIRKTDAIHIHTTVAIIRFFHILIGRLFFKRVVVTIHSLTTIKTAMDIFLLRNTLRFAHEIVVVSNEINQILNIPKARIIPAFLPPKIGSEPELPIEVKNLLESNKTKKIVISNAYRLNLFNKEDLYGTDLLIEVAKKLKNNKNKEIKIIFVITTLEVNKHLYDRYLNIINKEQLSEYITIIPYPLSFVKLIQKCDLVVRATNTDGDAITVREAIYFNKPVIASDVVVRPKKAILFKNRDYDDLYSKIIENINIPNILIGQPLSEYKNIYKRLYLKEEI
tara:strand:- start:2981 stop:4006 length:1026 start_codon:yes stop_codon:yes gene_type:complete